MKRAVPILLLTVAGLVPLWRFESQPETAAAPGATAGAPTPTTTGEVGAAGVATQSVDGALVRTRHGDVQVEVVFEGDRIASVTMLKQPDSAPTRKAVPLLVRETLTAQSADVDTVSGATTTSEAYAESLQAAIDAKG
ncbi:FMN-binding protein [Saccharothrix longispora]|uniref:FMN-binding protein n=1 Tax=Saccharothrix longispora TaxID=33920 RepID=UPI0028FDAF58|nr:FMN-binding protein [Saccharothrix longispora]MBY8849273.1 FMN-binding protein [Saccharothrix sp. MB29]MDU0293801.1 FMN-binding protein [Saccharothrix longispora]